MLTSADVHYSESVRRRLLNLLFHLLTALSLVLCVAVVVLWGRTYSRPESLTWVRSDGSNVVARGLYAGGGMASYDWTILPAMQFRGPLGYHRRTAGPLPPEVSRIRPSWFSLPDYASFATPFWIPTLVTAIAPAVWLMRRGSWRRRAGHCPRCGYDLRATPERCPECGWEPGPTPARAGNQEIGRGDRTDPIE